MVLESHEPRMERNGDFTVAGVARRDEAVEKAELWSELDAYDDELDDVAIGAERYGVVYDIDDDSGEFTYVAGVQVDSTDDLPPELTAVDVPETTYAVFETTAGAVEDAVVDVETGEFGSVDHDPDVGLVFERYDPGVRPGGIETDLDFFVPVRDD